MILLGFAVGAFVASLFLRTTEPDDDEHLGVEAGWPVDGAGGKADDRN
jgi:hypothetical protein